MTTVTIPIVLTIDGVAVPSSMTLDPSLLPPGPKGATGLTGATGATGAQGPIGPAGPAYVPPALPPAPTNLAALAGDGFVTFTWNAVAG